jgi:4-amino-4-deoxy-L-arabinose transferase-like glycosyltransferase
MQDAGRDAALSPAYVGAPQSRDIPAVTSRSSWLDPKGLRFAIGVAILAACANGVWILLDNSTPSWDQSHYLTVTLTYRGALESGGPVELLRAIHSTDPSHGPLFTVLMLPLVGIFGSGPRSALLLNFLLAPVLYVSAGQIAWIVFRDWIARLLTIGLVATVPILVGLNHEILQDFLLVTLTTVSLMLLLQTDGFRRGPAAVALGLAMGLGTLTKVTFPLFVAGPLLVVGIQILASQVSAGKDTREPNRVSVKTLARNIGLAALAYLILVAPWYGPNLSATLEYVRSTTSGPLSLGAGPTNPYTFDAIASFSLGVINANVSWIILLAGIVAIALCLPQLRRLITRPIEWGPILGIAFLLAWVLVPYLSVALAHNQDVRLMAPAVPGLAVLVAGAISAVTYPRVRLALIATLGVLLSYQTLNHTADVTPSVLPGQLDARLGPYEAVIPLSSKPIGYERLPSPDYGTPVIAYIEDVLGQSEAPPTVCLLESEPVVNSNTFRYLAEARGDEFIFTDIFVQPGELGDLRERLRECNFALYVRQPPPNPVTAGSRLALVNAEYAARYMNPGLLSLFKGPRQTFAVGEPVVIAGQNSYLTTSGSGAWVHVLAQRPDAS